MTVEKMPQSLVLLELTVRDDFITQKIHLRVRKEGGLAQILAQKASYFESSAFHTHCRLLSLLLSSQTRAVYNKPGFKPPFYHLHSMGLAIGYVPFLL